MFAEISSKPAAISRCCENLSIPTRSRAFHKLRFVVETHMRGLVFVSGRVRERDDHRGTGAVGTTPMIAIQTRRVKEMRKNCGAQ